MSKVKKDTPIALSVDTAPVKLKGENKRTINWIEKPVNTTRKDIRDHRRAQAAAESTERPINYLLQNIYTNVWQDGLLTSQIRNRQSKIFNIGRSLLNEDGTVNDEQTDLLTKIIPFKAITEAILDTTYFEYSLIDLSWKTNVDGTKKLIVKDLPRSNILPQSGIFLPDVNEDKGILYREAQEYGIWWLEFGGTNERGLLNKAVPHVLMKSFAQSCWAELCEIYGIPPRYMKTNTQDAGMLKRAESMMRDMGAATWFIIDETEEFSFADGVSTNGDVYSNLISLCNNELSMLISGAIIGQDTKNGSRSKEDSSQYVLWELVMEDMIQVQDAWNNVVIPALVKIGVLKGNLSFKFDIPEDLETLWTRVKDSMQSYDFDTDWMNEKFGLQITRVKQNPMIGGNLNAEDSFFV
jgi:hypothetical protein